MTKKAARLTAEEIAALVDTEGMADDPASAPVEVKAVEFADFGDEPALGRTPAAAGPEGLGFLWDVPMTFEVVLGSTTLTVREVMEMGPGSVVDLDRAYGEPVDILLNGRLVARGDVVVVGDQFGVKITEILMTGEEMAALAPRR